MPALPLWDHITHTHINVALHVISYRSEQFTEFIWNTRSLVTIVNRIAIRANLRLFNGKINHGRAISRLKTWQMDTHRLSTRPREQLAGTLRYLSCRRLSRESAFYRMLLLLSRFFLGYSNRWMTCFIAWNACYVHNEIILLTCCHFQFQHTEISFVFLRFVCTIIPVVFFIWKIKEEL